MLVEAEMSPIKNSSGKITGQKTTFYCIRTNLTRRLLSDSALALRSDRKAYWQKVLGTSDTSKIWTKTFTEYFDSTHLRPVDTTLFLVSVGHKDARSGKGLTDTTSGNGTETGIGTNNGTGIASNADYHFPPISFDFSKAGLRTDALKELNQLAEFLKAHPDWRLQINGYTDSKGSDQYNAGLSLRRSVTAENYIHTKGIQSKRLETKGLGKAHPIAPNENPDGSDNPSGRSLNRRVEFHLITP